MLVIPAIDIKGGQCVRLYQGNYRQVTVFSRDPVQVARRWAAAGAPLLHVVDLDGAAAGQVRNLAVVQAIISQVSIPVQLGGGAREIAAIETLLAMGVARVVLGTAAVENPAMVEEACRRWGERIAVSIDARDGMVAIRGWRETSPHRAVELARGMVALGARRLIYTDIARDGTLTEPNYAAIGELAAALNVPVIASGGVASLSHLERLREAGVEGAIVGRALYTGAVNLAVAIQQLRE